MSRRGVGPRERSREVQGETGGEQAQHRGGRARSPGSVSCAAGQAFRGTGPSLSLFLFR